MAKSTSRKPARVAKKASPAAPAQIKPTIRFSAELLRPAATEKSGPWTLLALPRSANRHLRPREATMVEGTIDGFPIRAVLEPASDSKETHRLRVNKSVRDAVGADVGDTVTVEITRVGDEPEVRAPADFREALAAAPLPKAQAVWADITPMARRDWVLWIISAKQEETRRRRIDNACDMLASGKRRPCCMPGINWRTKDSDVTSEETWIALPGSKGRGAAGTPA